MIKTFKMEDDQIYMKCKTTKENIKWKTTKKFKMKDNQNNQKGRRPKNIERKTSKKIEMKTTKKI